MKWVNKKITWNDFLDFTKAEPISTIFLTTISAVSLVVEITALFTNWSEIKNWVTLLLTFVITFCIFYLVIKLWQSKNIFEKYSKKLSSYLGKVSRFRTIHFSKIEKEMYRWLNKPTTYKILELSDKQIAQEMEYYNKQISSLMKNYLQDIFLYLDEFIEDVLEQDIDLTLQLFTSDYEVNGRNMYYEAFVEYDRMLIKDSEPKELTVAMNDILYVKKALVLFQYNAEDNSILIPLTSRTIKDGEKKIYGFLHFKLSEKIDRFIEGEVLDKLISEIVVAKCESLCYYLKVVDDSFSYFGASLYSMSISKLKDLDEIGEEESDENEYNKVMETHKFIEKIYNDNNFLKKLYRSFITSSESLFTTEEG